jgi:outer membrane receptor protein involved in Fe transport
MKIYIDGVDAASYGINAVDPESIERIEVTRGPQASTLYGSDAAGGVVQIYTKRGSGASARPHVEATAEAGVVQTPYPGFNGVVRQRYAAAVRGGSAEATYNLGGGYMHLGDWVPNGELSAQSSPSAYGGLRYSRGLVTVELAGRYLVHNAGGPLNPLLRETGFFLLSQPFYEQRRFTNQTTSARVEITPAAWWRTTLTAGVDGSTQDFIQTRPRLTTPDDTLLSLATQQSRKVSLAVSSAAEAGIARGVVGSLVAGVDHYNWPTVVTSTIQALNTEGTVQTSPAGSLDVSRSVVTNTGYFAQAQLAIHDAVYVTGGVRLDENSSFGRNAGTAFAPRIGLSVSQQAGAATIKLRGSYGSAIRPPRPGQAFGSVSAFSVLLPNPQLAPERQRGWDGGLDVFFNSRVSLSLTGYTQTARDLILLAQVAPPTDQALQLNQYQNVGRVTNRGIEVEGSYSGNRFQFRGQYGYVRSRIADLGSLSTGDVRVGDRPLQVPVHTAGATFTLLPRTGTSITSSLTYIGSLRYYDTMALYSCLGGTRPCRADARDYVVDYPSIAKVNASVTQSLTRELSAFVTVDNVTNNQRHEANNGTAVIGRITSVGLHFSY